MTPFEREYGVPDLPGGWPESDFKFKLDEAALRQKLDLVKDVTGHATVISDELAALASDSINSKVEVGEGERSSEGESRCERDIWVTKLVVHPIKVSHQQQSSTHTAYNLRLRLSSPFAHKKKEAADLGHSVSTRNSRFISTCPTFALCLLWRPTV